MPQSHQEVVAEAFKQLWSRIYNPRSASPDVELGSVEQEMARILMSLGTGEGTPEEQWVLAQLLLGPKTLGTLQAGWSEHELAQIPVPEDPTEFEFYCADQDNRAHLASAAIEQAVNQLLSDGRIQRVEDDSEKLRLP